ncbi:MAG TPA: pyruvate dehydrogenase complex dihydrolipoamide acetyltransferase [Candidatus Megaira endosymbiont of Stentor roeselii]|nr:pyruvate dehydrogenase complex dihydrolipoamide acetyltransferase [Candidatus Megaera endosymbiont of Stentor roeselii]
MPIKILMPALSPTMTEGNLAKWVKKEGEKISAGEVIAEIETDKATMEVEAVDEGVIAKILIPEGTEGVQVNSLIAVLIEEDEEDADIEAFIAKFNTSEKTVEKSAKEKTLESTEVKLASVSASTSTSAQGITTNKRIFASPLAKRIAALEGISLSNIIGSGPHGRIIKNDILSAAKNTKGTIRRDNEEYRLVPNNNMRKVIAKRLLESKLTVPHFYLSIECIMDSVVNVRAQINANFESDKDKRLSVNDFIILACGKALKEVPAANASWTDSAIMLYNNVDISVAVAIEGGLITPIIKNADQKDIVKISSEMKDLAKRARENALAPEEFQGGGFSISNLGMYGIKSFSAIVNPPQGCIMAVGISSKRPVIIDDKVEIRTIMDVTLSCDHRVVDGAVGAEFLAAFKKYIEAPILMFV